MAADVSEMNLRAAVQSGLVQETDASSVNAFAQANKTVKEVGGQILTGPSVQVSSAERQAFMDRFSRLYGKGGPDQAKALMEMMNSYFETAMNTAKNMGPSEKELELRRRRAEELKKQINDLEAKKVTVEEALIRFQNTFLAAADKALLEQNLAKQRPEMA